MRIYQSESSCRTERVREQDIETQINAGGALADEARLLREWRDQLIIPANAKLISQTPAEDCYEWEGGELGNRRRHDAGGKVTL